MARGLPEGHAFDPSPGLLGLLRGLIQIDGLRLHGATLSGRGRVAAAWFNLALFILLRLYQVNGTDLHRRLDHLQRLQHRRRHQAHSGALDKAYHRVLRQRLALVHRIHGAPLCILLRVHFAKIIYGLKNILISLQIAK